MQGCIEILKRAHGKTAPKTNYPDIKPTTNRTCKTLLEITGLPARNQIFNDIKPTTNRTCKTLPEITRLPARSQIFKQHKQPKYLQRLLSQ